MYHIPCEIITTIVGPVAHADVLLGPDGRSKGCGVVEFQTAEDAKTAIRKMNDVVLRGRPVFVREDRESGERIGASGGRAQSSRSADVAIRQVFVGNVSYFFDVLLLIVMTFVILFCVDCYQTNELIFFPILLSCNSCLSRFTGRI